MIQLILYSLIAGLFSLIGGMAIMWKYRVNQAINISLFSFAGGAFMAVAMLDILPEALEAVAEPHPILMASLIGFGLFFVLERILMTQLYQHKNVNETHSDHTESLPLLLIIGDGIHNFLDGVVIALSYIVNPSAGLITALAITAHEIPQEIGDFSILLNQGWPKRKVVWVNILQSIITIPGVILGYYLGNALDGLLPYLLGLTTGVFVYLAASDIIPEIHHKAGHKYLFRVIIPFILSLIIVGYLVRLTH